MNITNERLVRGHTATISATLIDQYGEPAAAAGTVTVQVTRGDGSTVLPAGTATTVPGTPGVYQRTLTAAQTANLDVLTAVWTDSGDSSTTTTLHAVVGGVYFTVAEARSTDVSIDGRYSAGAIIAARQDVEDEFESICGVAFVPRWSRVRLSGDGTGRLVLPDPMPRALRSIWVYNSSTTYTALTAGELAACHLDPSGTIYRRDGGVFADGALNVVAEYEHGYAAPPAEIKRYAIKRLRQTLSESTSAVPARATSFQVADAGVFRLATAGRYRTGDPDIDGALARYSLRTPGIA